MSRLSMLAGYRLNLSSRLTDNLARIDSCTAGLETLIGNIRNESLKQDVLVTSAESGAQGMRRAMERMSGAAVSVCSAAQDSMALAGFARESIGATARNQFVSAPSCDRRSLRRCRTSTSRIGRYSRRTALKRRSSWARLPRELIRAAGRHQKQPRGPYSTRLRRTSILRV